LTKEGEVYAADCHVTIDDNSVFKHPELGIKVPRDMDREPTILEQLAWDQTAGTAALATLSEEHEQELMINLSRYPEVIETAALNHEPHQLTNYLRELANDFHTYYNAHVFLVDNDELRNARLALIDRLLGLRRLEEMETALDQFNPFRMRSTAASTSVRQPSMFKGHGFRIKVKALKDAWEFVKSEMVMEGMLPAILKNTARRQILRKYNSNHQLKSFQILPYLFY